MRTARNERVDLMGVEKGKNGQPSSGKIVAVGGRIRLRFSIQQGAMADPTGWDWEEHLGAAGVPLASFGTDPPIMGGRWQSNGGQGIKKRDEKIPQPHSLSKIHQLPGLLRFPLRHQQLADGIPATFRRASRADSGQVNGEAILRENDPAAFDIDGDLQTGIGFDRGGDRFDVLRGGGDTGNAQSVQFPKKISAKLCAITARNPAR